MYLGKEQREMHLVGYIRPLKSARDNPSIIVIIVLAQIPRICVSAQKHKARFAHTVLKHLNFE